MFNRFGRVRLMLRDNADDQADDTRVLVRQRTGWVMLLAAYTALFCLPTYRAFMSDQAVRALARKSPGWMSAAMGQSSDARERLLTMAGKSPEERDLQLGAAHLTATPVLEQVAFADPRVKAVDALRGRYPNDPVPVAHVLRLCCTGGSTLGRKELGDVLGRQFTPGDLSRMEALCRDGARLDPENGYFPTMLAVMQFRGMRDQEALQSLHAASVCGTWKDYAFHQGVGGRDLLIRTFGDRGLVMHALPSASILLPHFQAIRQSAQLAMLKARTSRSAGDLQSEHRTRTDVIRLGSLMRRNADTLIGRLVGAGVEDLGFGLEPHRLGPAASDNSAKAAVVRQGYAAVIAGEAPALAAEVTHELKSFNRFLEIKREHLDDNAPFKVWDQVILSDIQRDVLGLTLLPNLAASLLCWLLASVVALAFRPRNAASASAAGQLGTWSPVSIALVLGFAGAVCAGVGLSVNLTDCWRGMLPALWLVGGDQSAPPVSVPGTLLCSGALGSVAILVAVLSGAAIRRRTLSETVEGARLAFKSAAAIAACLYLAYGLMAVPGNARDARTWESGLEQEMQARPL